MSLGAVSPISLSGMNAAALRLSASANNSANQLTKGYKRASVVQTELLQGGVSTKISKLTAEGADPVADAVDRIGAVYSFKANIVTLRVADEMTGTVLKLHR